MMGQRRAPAMEDGGDADPGAEVLWVGGDGQHRIGRRLEQQIIDACLVVEGDRGDLGGQGEDDVEIADREQVGLASLEPAPRSGALAPGTMPVAATVLGGARVSTVGAGYDMSRSAEHTSELRSLMRTSNNVYCLD